MQVICEKCHASHRLEHIRVREGLFLCSRCGRKSRFPKELAAKEKQSSPALPKPTPLRLQSQPSPETARKPPSPLPPEAARKPLSSSSPESTRKPALSPPKGTPSVGAAPQKKRWQILRADGTRITLQGLGSLQEWIIEGTLRREDQISRLGQKWKRLGEIQELLPFFEEADRRAAQLAAQIQASGPGATIPFPVVKAEQGLPPKPPVPPRATLPMPVASPPPPEEEGRTETLRGVTANPPPRPQGGTEEVPPPTQTDTPGVVSTAPVVLSRPASPLRVRQAPTAPPFQVQEPPGPRMISTPRFPYEVRGISPSGKEENPEAEPPTAPKGATQEEPASSPPKEAIPPPSLEEEDSGRSQTEPSLLVALANALSRDAEGEAASIEAGNPALAETLPEPEKAPPPPNDEITLEPEASFQSHQLPVPARVDFAPPEALSVSAAPVSVAPYEDSGDVAPYSPHSALEQAQTYRELEIKSIEHVIQQAPPSTPPPTPRYVSKAPALQVDARLAREMEEWRQGASPEGQVAPTRPLRLHARKNLLPLWIALSALILGGAALLIALWPTAPRPQPSLQATSVPEEGRHKTFVQEGDAALFKDGDEDLELASTFYKQALGLKEGYPPALAGLVLVHTRRAAHLQDDAARDALVLATLEGDLKESLEEATRLRVRIDFLQEEAQKELRWAQKYADQVLKVAPEERITLAAIAEYQLLARDREGFLESLSRLGQRFPQAWEITYLQGLFSFQEVGQESEGEAKLKEVLKEVPGLIRARYQLARYLEEQKRFEEAKEQAALILTQSPRHTRAEALQKRLSQDGAIVATPAAPLVEPPPPEELSEEAEKSADDWAKEGDRLARKGKFGDALDAYLAALDQDPRHLPALLGAGSAYLRQGRPDYACSKYRLALEVSPRNAEALFGAAECHNEMKNQEEAIRRYKDYLSRAPKGAYAETARKKLSDLGVVVAPPKEATPASAPTP